MDGPILENETNLSKEVREKIVGSDAVLKYFGLWPSFHDAEIMELRLHRAEPSWLQILVATDGFRPSQKHGIVRFQFEEVLDLELRDFSRQNVINSISIEQTEKGFKFRLSPCYGLAGWLEVSAVRVEVIPKDSN